MSPLIFDEKDTHYLSVHPAVFRAAIGMAAGMAAAAGIFLAHDLQMVYVLGVVAAFTVVAVSIPLLLARMSRSAKARVPLARWRHGELEICTGCMRTWEAALLILIAPLASVLGLAALCFIALLASRGAL